MNVLNSYQQSLYNDLLALTQVNEAFYFKDSVKDGVLYRVFSYRLASYSDFLLPSALECRGVMFEIAEDATPVRLAALPMNKFFNYKENPITMNLDFHNAKQIMYKLDGSLISTYYHNGDLCFKSKTALESDHAKGATQYILGAALTASDGISLYSELQILNSMGYTVNFEFTSPNYPFRIVIGYQETKLTILNIRSRVDGTYITLEYAVYILNTYYDNFTDTRFITSHWVDTVTVKNEEMDDFIADIDNMSGIEGFVIQLQDGMLVKLKTNWYRTLHHVKDSINSMRRLFEAVLEETTDDLRAMLCNDGFALLRITEMETKVTHIYNSIVKNVEGFYNTNKHLDRKDYAVTGQAELTHIEFGLAMNMYVGKVVDYKSTIKKNYKLFGITDDAPVIIEDE